MTLYSKTISKDSFEYQFYKSIGFPPIKNSGDLAIRITFDDMALIDGFYMPLPFYAEYLSIKDIIENHIICKENVNELSKAKKLLSKYPNPDLLDFIDMLDYIYKKQKDGKLNIKYHINNGESNIPPDEKIYLHQQLHVDDNLKTYKLLDLVLEIKDCIDPFYLVTKEQKDSMLDGFRQLYILYFCDKFGYFPNLENIQAETAYQISEILDKLSDQEYVNSDDGVWQITHKGYELLDNIIDEAEFYIDNFDIFSDVYIRKFSEIKFGTGFGDNMIVPILWHKGFDPYRVLFLVSVYLGNFDEMVSDYSALFTEEPFNKVFEIIADSNKENNPSMNLLEFIISEGSAKISEQNFRYEKLKTIDNINRRLNLL